MGGSVTAREVFTIIAVILGLALVAAVFELAYAVMFA